MGTRQIPKGYELVDTTTYAKRVFLSVRTVQSRCKCGQLTAYKNAGKWLILTKVV
ncbi:MAG: hypothetical protein AAGI69_12670 [Cyanobacteria bacterium P01_H01_bin.21]